MKYNNGDMDDLFRRASEGYPLRTDRADWDRLAGALDGEPAAPSDQEEKRRRRGAFWWLLLIPLAGVGYLTWQVAGNHTPKKEITAAPRVGGTAGQAGAGAAGTGGAGTGVAGTGVAGTGGTRNGGVRNGLPGGEE